MNHAHSIRADSAQDRYALRVAARLAEATDDLPYDVGERLRAARMQALSQRKVPARAASLAAAVQSAGNGQAVLRGGPQRAGWFARFASVLPIVALVAGIIAIDTLQDERRANEAAEVDAALLTDDLPPSAYTDPGFLQFLNDARAQQQP